MTIPSFPKPDLPDSIIDWCKTEALSQCLVAWGQDSTELSFDRVLELLREKDASSYELSTKHEIMFWYAYENEQPYWVANRVESIYESCVECAEFTIKVLKENN